ncbi:hypothetical protein TNCV_2121791 [Trichonephila clavipes]|nr:hypothetical protein TNCV_2121791 [Trichonephila clavipes]
MWACIILLKDSSSDALKEGNDFGLLHFEDVPVAVEITLNSSNRIMSLPDDMFDNMPKLHTVYFDNNKLTTFTSTIWQKPYSKSLEEIHLLGNPFICDCSIIWFKKQSRKPTITGECKEPKNLEGRWLRDLSPKDFTYCPKAPSIQ